MELFNVYFEDINDEMFVVGSYEYCFGEEDDCSEEYNAVIVNSGGEIVKDYRDKGTTMLHYYD